MTRPSRKGGKTSGVNPSPAKGRKTTKTKPRISPAATRVKRRSISDPSKDLKEAREQQAATAEILKVIASSADNVQPVLEAIVHSSKRLLGGHGCGLYKIVDEMLHLEAFTPVSPESDETVRNSFPIPVSEYPQLALIEKGESFQFADTEDAPEIQVKVARLRGFRSIIVMPLRSRGATIGMIACTRREPGVFADHDVQLLQTFADQAVIAIENVRLFNEVQAKTADLQESLQQQTATSDLLQVISRSAFDLQSIFNAIAERAVTLCGADRAFIYRFTGEMLHMVTAHNTPRAFKEWMAQHPIPLDRHSGAGRAALERRSVHIHDVRTDPEYTFGAKDAEAIRTILAVPVLKRDELLGVMVIYHLEGVRPFTEKHIALVETFADQAAIAIENARLFNETEEALERQTATADILKVIASSPSDVQPVFEAIAERSNRLVEGFSTAVYTLVDDIQHLMAFTRTSPAADAALKALFPRPLSAVTAWGDQIRNGEIVHIPDSEVEWAGQPSLLELSRLRGFRSALLVPLLRDRTPIGLISVTRKEPGTFAAHHVQLLQTFADQAVIAIENVRLFDEVQAKTRDLTEALQQQTASAAVLKVISSSPGKIEPVFDRILASARQLCDAKFGHLLLFDGETWRAEALHNVPEAYARFWNTASVVADPETNLGRVQRSGKSDQVSDVRLASGYLARTPLGVATAELGGARTLLTVPLLKEGKVIGGIALYRTEVRPFDGKQVELLSSFADQAVIAIENARLFNETQEALARQTATADVLKVIASSPSNLQPVFDAIAERSKALIGAHATTVVRFIDGMIRLEAYTPVSPEADAALLALFPRKPTIEHEVVIGGEIGRIHDAESELQGSAMLDVARARGWRSRLYVPLKSDTGIIGWISVTRKEAGAFADKDVELLQTFADQAVIAIQNVELFDEVQAKTRDLTEALTYQTGSANILGVIASSPTDVQPVLQSIVESACELCDAVDAIVLLKDGDSLRNSAHHGPIPLSMERWPLGRNWVAGRTFLDRKPVHLHDLLSAEGDEFPETKARQRAARTGTRTILSVPLLREGKSIGTVVLRRTEVHPFSDKQIALLQTFADQAVIAIGNVRLFDEVQAKTRDLTESLQQQTATADVLKVISRSAFDLQPVLDTIVETASRLCDAEYAFIYKLHDDGKYHMAANHGADQVFLKYAVEHPLTPGRGSLVGRTALERKTVHMPDCLADPEYVALEYQSVGHYRSNLGVPLLREGVPIGVIILMRAVVMPFTDRQIELVTTFADQAVIAIENVSLFDEVQARTKDLAASLDDLRTAQDRLIQTEKLASLGQLTAGIAHEIKNPLNFVNNFSALTAELTDELNDLLKPVPLDDKMRGEADELTGMIKDNLRKVVQHGKRADSIVKNMLLHSREGCREYRPADINSLLDESLNLAYHGARAEKGEFNIILQRDFDADAGTIELFPQEITRAFLNLIANGVYAATRRKTEEKELGFEPTLRATTKNLGTTVEIRIRDNGAGIPPEVQEKMFNPFFTTKPAGEGTGLGLSMTHDIIVKQHGGRIDVDTEPGIFTEFIITLPRKTAAQKATGGTN